MRFLKAVVIAAILISSVVCNAGEKKETRKYYHISFTFETNSGLGYSDTTLSVGYLDFPEIRLLLAKKVHAKKPVTIIGITEIDKRAFESDRDKE